MNFNFIHNKKFIKIAIGLIAVIIVVSVGFNFATIKEGLTNNNYTSCDVINSLTNPADRNCKNCLSAKPPGGTCYWNPNAPSTSRCSAFDDPGYSKNCNDPSSTCSSKVHRIGCLLSSGCAWDNGQCRIDNQPGFDKCAGNTNCIPCVLSGCYWSNKSGGSCAKTELDNSYSRFCKNILPPVNDNKCSLYSNCKPCVQNGCMWGGDSDNPNCVNPNSMTDQTGYSKQCFTRNDDGTTSTTDTTDTSTTDTTDTTGSQ
jgi:hypothetical protein